MGQEELAARMGRQVTWIRQREGHSVRMTRDEADRLAAVLGTDFAGLLLAAGAP